MPTRLLKSALLSASVWLSEPAFALDNPSREFQLKSAYLFHFAELTQWPAIGPITICLRGDSPIRHFLPALEGQKIEGNIVHVLLEPPATLEACNILFVGDIDELKPRLFEQARAAHILLVGDVDGFAAQGGMVQFTLRDNKLKLVVNLGSVKSADLKLSSKLLRMAEIIE